MVLKKNLVVPAKLNNIRVLRDRVVYVWFVPEVS